MTELHTPQYVLRRNLILHLLDRYQPGRFLEFGCGRGELLAHLVERGFSGIGVEISDAARAVAAARCERLGDAVEVVGNARELGNQRFSFVMAFEVLEHIDDDAAALREWLEYLEPGGTFLLSVPAHMSKWTDADTYGGHQRRYERVQLEHLLQSAGLEIEELWSYGFPVTAVTRRLRGLAYRRRMREIHGLDPQERTLRSSFDSTRRPGRSGVAGSLVELGGRLAHLAQLPFRRSELGDGFLVSCRR